MTYFLFVLITIYASSHWGIGAGGDGAANKDFFGIAVLSVLLLTAGAVFHEIGHLFVTRRLGGRYDEIVLWPFGSVGPTPDWPNPKRGALAALAGPLANLLLCFICAALLLPLTKGFNSGLLHPLSPRFSLIDSYAVETLELAFWINWLLFVVNLIPAFPFDGGNAVYCLLGMIWPDLPHRRRQRIVGQTVWLVAIGLLFLALSVTDAGPRQSFPVWMGLALLAVFLLFAARRGEEDDIESAPAESHRRRQESIQWIGLEQDASPDVSEAISGLSEEWMEDGHLSARLREETEAEEEKHLDEILARLHATGMDGLSAEDRELLDRISARYRGRQSSS
jgi:Zn-dependent protease